ncbi:hypothetical protein CspeluHIS016_0107770 [Cutaneotrichosporon spelunceum]|uniref:RRN6 beta-propeller domain-containing protein n=1 Tax=Cutaneotrichosporon spelunceum TaxID=1672016 RepID=A0AAD3TNN2_9TREE|nr:hypothetical protein CspeluHIS016_0107770 [Cutaneotrichosporon spelunceum]
MVSVVFQSPRPKAFVPSVMAVSVVEPPTRLASGPNRREAEPALASGPHAGETAVFVSLDSRRGLRQLSQVLVYACGTRESRLGVIPLWPESQTHNAGLRDDDRGGSHSVDTYNSPILQIASSPYLSGRRVDGGATSMVVRLENTTHLINLYANPEFSVASSSPPILVTRVAELDRRLTDGLRHVDVAIDPREWSRVAIVDEGGGVWLWWEEKELVKHRLAKLTKL